MLIKDLTKELDSSAMAAIQGARNISPTARMKMLNVPPPRCHPRSTLKARMVSTALVLPPGAAD